MLRDIIENHKSMGGQYETVTIYCPYCRQGMAADATLSNRRLSQVISADYFRRKHLSQSAVNDADAHYIGSNRRLSRAYFSSAEAGLK